MNPHLAAALLSWSIEPAIAVAIALTAALYLRGFSSLRRLHPERLPTWRRTAFLAGLGTFWIAVASPIDAFADLFLQAHMAQHVLLMLVAPPLVWLGAPANPILHGLPRRVLAHGLGPFLGWPALGRVGRFLTHPVTAWLLFSATLWAWHAPRAYQLALRDPFWHDVEHLSFFGAALLFWYPVVQPWPGHAVWPRAAMLPYLALAGVQMTAFSAVFAFSSHVYYPAYLEVPRLFATSALTDQRAAGAVMWVPGSIVLLVAIGGAAFSVVEPRIVQPSTRGTAPMKQAPPLWRSAVTRTLMTPRTRRVAQWTLLLLALAIVIDGAFGPTLAERNAAGVLPWTFWRACAVVGLVVAGNWVCFACPFTLPRSLARRWLGGDHTPPPILRSKWIGVALFVAFLISYEVFDLWNRPGWTATIIAGYFAAAFAVDGRYGAATFCRSTCPIGQFQFTGALVSPLEVGVRSDAVCARCTTHECLVGDAASPGCELDLFQPAKIGNLDCTFCFDCATACPHDNVTLRAHSPLPDLVSDAPRAGLGRLSARADLAAFARIFVFGAFANAAAMVAPVTALRDRLAAASPVGEDVATAILLAVALVAVPFGVTRVCTHLGAFVAHDARATAEQRRIERRFVFGLVPLGLALWLGHFVFHGVTAGPAWQNLAARASGEVGASMAAPWLAIESLMAFEIAALGVGLWISAAALWKIALDLAPNTRRAFSWFMPWGALALALWALGLWIVFQPMEMRGAMTMAGMG